jgi:hypothetical protein
VKRIEPSPDRDHNWPRHEAKTVECRKRDLVIRISNWTRDRSEPAYDVEVYIGGVYDWNESETLCARNAGKTNAQAKVDAIAFAQKQIARLL